MTTTPHTCHAEGCDVVVARSMFMCKRHWFMLPKATRDHVWAAYTVGQEHDMSLVTEEYLDVAMAAIEWLAEKEGRR